MALTPNITSMMCIRVSEEEKRLLGKKRGGREEGESRKTPIEMKRGGEQKGFLIEVILYKAQRE